MIYFISGCVAAGAQPPGYVSSIDAAQKNTAIGSVGIAQVWGEELIPPSNCPRAIINLKDALLKWTSLDATVENHVILGTSAIMKFPILFVSTDQPFQLTETEKKNLREYLKSGGFLMVDNASAGMDNSPAGAALKQMITDVLGSSRMEPVSNSHEIFNSPMVLGGPPAGSATQMQQVGARIQKDGTSVPSMVMPTESKIILGASINGKLAVVYSNMGYTKKWNDNSGNDPQLKFGVNLIMYAMKLKKGE